LGLPLPSLAGRPAATPSLTVSEPGAFDDHWSLQVDLLVTDIIDYHVVGRFERFGYHKDSWRYE